MAPRQSPTAESVHRVNYNSAQDPNEAPAAPCSDHWNPADGDCCLCPVLLQRSDEWTNRHNTPGRRQEVGSVTINTLWVLVPWAVFAIAAGVRFWRLTAQFPQNLLGVPTKTELFRQALERVWQKGQQVRST